jgi:hypothetical protein
MIFEAEPDQVEALDSKELVQLMKLLILAECRLAQIPLRAAHVPLQITVPDGGEDGRVEWCGGADSTPYFPRRYSVFQSKAQKLTDSSVKAEVLKKPVSAAARKSRKKSTTATRKAPPATTEAPAPTLSRAISGVLKRQGAYILFSSGALIGDKREKLKGAVAAAIRQGGGDPERIVVEILDSNAIAEWINVHPSVALWLAQHTRRRSLAGFQTHGGWGKSADIRASPWANGDTARFSGGTGSPSADDGPAKTMWSFDEAADVVLTWLEPGQRCVRISGPSGFGKTRFAYEIFSRSSTLASEADNAALVYADHTIVGDEATKLAMEIAESGSPSILIVDECPDHCHLKLSGIAQRSDSNLRLVTIDVETRIPRTAETLVIRLEPANDDLVSSIAKGINPKIDDTQVRLIQNLARGFTQMAVLAAKQKGSSQGTIQSAEQYVERLLWGKSQPNAEAYKALSSLSLFNWIGIDGRVCGQARYIAENVAGMPLDLFVEHIKTFKRRGIVAQRGDFVLVQPIPLAARLASDRLRLMSEGRLAEHFLSAPDEVKGSLLRRIRWLDAEPEAKAFVRSVLAPEGLGNLNALNSKVGSEILDRLVHVDPDHAMTVIERTFGGLSIEELEGVVAGRRHLVWALEKLVFRRATFERAARLLRRLGAAEIEDQIGNNASGEFASLYQLYLSGTEASPEERLRVLDEGLRSSNLKEREICLDALGRMLHTTHFSRSGGSEEIGSSAALEDWRPKTYGEVRGFLRAAIDRLSAIALSDDPLGDRAMSLLGAEIRGLLNHFGPKEIKGLVGKVVSQRGFWQQAVEEINEWLFFDSKDAPPKVRKEVRNLFDELLPADPVVLAMMYCSGWPGDFHDPDSVYDKDNLRSDFKYAERTLRKCAETIAEDTTAIDRLVRLFPSSDAKMPFSFAHRLAEVVADPVSLFQRAAETAEASEKPPNISFLAGLISGMDAREPALASACVPTALRSPKLRPHAVSLVGARKLQMDDLKLVASLLDSGEIAPAPCASLSYGRGLDHLTTGELEPLLDALMRQGAVGLWTALDVIYMYLYQNVAPDPEMGERIKQILLADQLFVSLNRGVSDGYHLEQMVALLAEHKLLTTRFVRSLASRTFSIADVKDSEVFFALDEPVRKVLRILIPLYPREVWGVACDLVISADPLRRFRLQSLLKPSLDDDFGGGPLSDIPPAIYLDWVRAEPHRRAHIVASWLPVAMKAADDSPQWHPVIVSFIDEFGSSDGVLHEVGRRIHPSSWWGSLVPHLEPWLPLLQQLLDHPVGEVRSWAQRQLDHLRDVIASERKSDDEDPVRFD